MHVRCSVLKIHTQCRQQSLQYCRKARLRVRHAELFVVKPSLLIEGLFLLVSIPMMMMVARIVGIEVMVAMMIAVVAMMVVVMMVAVPRCGGDRAAGRDSANNT